MFTCEHGSIRFPRRYGQLGLSKTELNSCKDWNDPGSLALTRILNTSFKSSFIAANFSRLLIDANRRLDAQIANGNTYHTCALKRHLLVHDGERDKTVEIPGNMVKDPTKEERNRWNEYVAPYQSKGLAMARSLRDRNGKVFVFQIHSFYPSYNGSKRKVDIDVAFDQSSQVAKRLIKTLRESTDLVIGQNDPWGIDVVDGGVFDAIQHEANSNLVAIDINNKHLQSASGIARIAKILSRAISKTIN